MTDAGGSVTGDGVATPTRATPTTSETEVRVRALRRPHPRLLRYYVLFSIVTGPAFPIVFGVLFLRYRTLHYRFDDEGVTMSWGALFKREISLTYSRIQDIHMQSNAVERWLGLSRLLVQTASGSAKAEMKIEGLLELPAVRNFMYSRMRGAGAVLGPASPAARGSRPPTVAAEPRAAAAESTADLAAVLQQIAAELGQIRAILERRP